ncbi:hypothetical protein HDZ31DRAFT_68609 [Schizophyllum fasciatum]
MSARTPFNPTRPAAVEPTDDANASSQFPPDPSNPLHSDSVAPTTQHQKTKNSRSSLGGAASAPLPLNVQSLTKPKKRPNTPSSVNKQSLHSASRTIDQSPARPASADTALQHKNVHDHRLARIPQHTNTLNNAAPSPRAAPPNTPGAGLQSNANMNIFKHPGLPASAAHDLAPEDAHIPTPASHLQRFTELTGALDLGEDPFFTSRREEYERRHPGVLPHSIAKEDVGFQQVSSLRSSVRNKRGRMDAEEMNNQEYPVNSKRYKGHSMNADGYDAPEEYDRARDGLSSPRSHHSEYQDSPARQPSVHHTPSAPHRSRSQARRSQQAQQPYVAPQPAPVEPIGLDRILGRETNAYVEANFTTYERLVKRWSDCTVDEWKAGADELTKKYGLILELAQKHMTAKLNLFASFDEKVDQHNKTLDNRSKVLASAKEKVIRDSTSLF